MHCEGISGRGLLTIIYILLLDILFSYLFRSVLSRAELDALPLDNNLKEDVEKGKVISTVLVVAAAVFFVIILLLLLSLLCLCCCCRCFFTPGQLYAKEDVNVVVAAIVVLLFFVVAVNISLS